MLLPEEIQASESLGLYFLGGYVTSYAPSLLLGEEVNGAFNKTPILRLNVDRLSF